MINENLAFGERHESYREDSGASRVYPRRVIKIHTQTFENDSCISDSTFLSLSPFFLLYAGLVAKFCVQDLVFRLPWVKYQNRSWKMLWCLSPMRFVQVVLETTRRRKSAFQWVYIALKNLLSAGPSYSFFLMVANFFCTFGKVQGKNSRI